MRRIALGLVALLCLTGQTGPLFNGSQFYEIGTCATTSSTCTVPLNNSYTSPSCFARDVSATNTINVECGVSGNTLTITTANTLFAGSCAMTTTTCTITSPYGIGSGSVYCSTINVSVVMFGKCAVSGTTVTVTSGTSNTNTWHAMLLYTNPAPTASHTYAYIVVQ